MRFGILDSVTADWIGVSGTQYKRSPSNYIQQIEAEFCGAIAIQEKAIAMQANQLLLGVLRQFNLGFVVEGLG